MTTRKRFIPTPLERQRIKELEAELEATRQQRDAIRERSKRYMTKWDYVDDLGRVPDTVIAKRMGCSARTVTSARSRRGIPAYVPPKELTVRVPCPRLAATKWDRILDIAEAHGIENNTEAMRLIIDAGIEFLG